MMSARTVVQGTRTPERETEGGRFGPTGVSLSGERAPTVPVAPDPEVPAHSTRRRLTATYKLRILERVEELRKSGDGSLGAFLRSEGLYYSAIQKWFRQRDAGTLGTGQRGAHRKGREVLLRENKALRRQLDAVKKRLHRTELVVDLQKKISEMLHLDNPETPLTHGKAS
jgi:hypothetical protein